ncbi:serine/threonine-protein kinase [Streptomyces doebereineriae]|uniref:non-specific serine/threonine protein kinase n=1 Tax=Streptomyces doebereineriae TaxID=3075528 RepID=A0ABU2VJ54_9ACTN|nr:serine/threonine-protein kinase [Streptomyces sp. DSM 41640]MDT0485229.1 serine/threonine-protein kinase [Streptomyces sp. DSM 41640]
MIGERYRLIRRLGEGGFGQVWKAHDAALGVDVAIKQVRLDDSLPDEIRAELLARAGREARNAARLRDHPHIVTVYDVVEVDDTPWIVMQLVDGHSLAEELEEHGPLTVDRAAAVAGGVLRALEAAHRAGVVHRDVKPANVMLAKSREVLLADFGIAVGHTDPRLTATALVIGSPGYIAPERLQGAQSDDRADLFSLGVTLYKAVEGVLPFPTDNPIAALTEPLRTPANAGRLTTLITGLLEKDPTRRPAVAEALAMLEASPEPPEPPSKKVTNNPVPDKPVTITNSTRELVKAYEKVPWGVTGRTVNFGCAGIFIGGIAMDFVLNHYYAPFNGPAWVVTPFLVWISVGLLIGCYAIAEDWLKAMYTQSDVVTINRHGISISRWTPQRRSFTVRWDTLEGIAVDNGCVIAWFNKTFEPTAEWQAANGVKPHQGGGFDIYTRADSPAAVDPKRLRDGLKKFAGPRYSNPKRVPDL